MEYRGRYKRYSRQGNERGDKQRGRREFRDHQSEKRSKEKGHGAWNVGVIHLDWAGLFHMTEALFIITCVYAAASGVAFGAYGLDKWRARSGRRRIRESTLHWLEALCGWPGAMLAQRVFRHKTVDRGFRRVFWVIVAAHAAAWAVAAWMWLRWG